jgi:hypothetical protein
MVREHPIEAWEGARAACASAADQVAAVSVRPPSGKLIGARQAQRLPTIDKPVDVDPALVATIERFRKAVKKE